MLWIVVIIAKKSWKQALEMGPGLKSQLGHKWAAGVSASPSMG